MRNYRIEIDKGEELILGNISQKSHEKFKFFVDNYQLEKELDGGINSNLGILLPKDERICRFCEKGFPDVSFNTIAHTIPQQWNRSRPINIFECDLCNEKFSKYESDFSHYFLANRALLGSKKKKGYPKYKTDAGTRVETVKLDELGLSDSEREKIVEKIGKDKPVVLIKQGGGEEVKREGNAISFNLLRKPFRPINVYKVFLKIGLSLIPEADLSKFSFLLAFLNSDKEMSKEAENRFSGLSIIHSQFRIFKSIFEFPVVYSYKMKSESENFIERIIIIFFENSFYQIPLPSDENFNQLILRGIKLKMAQISPYLNPSTTNDAMDSEIFHDDMENIYEEEVNFFCSRLIENSRVEFTIEEV